MNSVLKAWRDLPPVFADRLMALLAAPERRVFGLHHVNQLLLEADAACHAHWLRPLRWAILYHCAVFDPLAAPEDNQRASAELWRAHFPAIHETVWGVSATWEDEAAAAIEACATPFSRPEDFLPWQHALADLTLGGLGEPPGFYEAARAWHLAAHVAAGGYERTWACARKNMLEQALAAPRLYHFVHQAREQRARENIERERAIL